jgi:hypothetical protein
VARTCTVEEGALCLCRVIDVADDETRVRVGLKEATLVAIGTPISKGV